MGLRESGGAQRHWEGRVDRTHVWLRLAVWEKIGVGCLDCYLSNWVKELPYIVIRRLEIEGS